MNDTPARRRGQWNLMTLLLVMAVAATWTAFWRARASVARMRGDIEIMRRASGELLVDDKSWFAVIDAPESWHDEKSWDVYLPPNHTYRLALATRDLNRPFMLPDTLPRTVAQTEILPGRHRIEWTRRQHEATKAWELLLTVDEKPALQHSEAPDWDPGRGGSGRGPRDVTEQHPVTQPLELARFRFSDPGQPLAADEAGTGYQIWIETARSSP